MGKGIEYQLRRAVENSGLSRSELSRISGVNSVRLSNFMKGKKPLTLNAAENVAKALGLGFKTVRLIPW
ncbi:MAG: helix-turn-helix domain-containing protein [Planctomycetota bacterium]|jgi:transcriptional regulator with XRE-family HTH domain